MTLEKNQQQPQEPNEENLPEQEEQSEIETEELPEEESEIKRLSEEEQQEIDQKLEIAFDILSIKRDEPIIQNLKLLLDNESFHNLRSNIAYQLQKDESALNRDFTDIIFGEESSYSKHKSWISEEGDETFGFINKNNNPKGLSLPNDPDIMEQIVANLRCKKTPDKNDDDVIGFLNQRLTPVVGFLDCPKGAITEGWKRSYESGLEAISVVLALLIKTGIRESSK